MVSQLYYFQVIYTNDFRNVTRKNMILYEFHHVLLGVLIHSMLNAKSAQNGIGWKLGDPKFTDWASLSLYESFDGHIWSACHSLGSSDIVL